MTFAVGTVSGTVLTNRVRSVSWQLPQAFMHLSLINPAIILDYQLDHGAGFDPVAIDDPDHSLRGIHRSVGHRGDARLMDAVPV